MLEKLLEIHPVTLALFATLFTYFVTALGSALVFFFKSINPKILNLMLGFAAGVMIAASYWSLLAPAIQMSEEIGGIKWLPAVIGFLAGAGFLFAVDRNLPHLHLGNDISQAEGIKTSWQRSVLLVLAITLHNIPEGLAVGVAFGALFNTPDIATLVGGLSLALGIGLQNFPEGAAVSIPLRREGFTRLKAFYYGQLSGIVEPIAGVIGAYLVFLVKPLLPYALAFAAGAMIYVAVEELIPESQKEDVNDFSTIGTIIGFTIMMFLDVALG